MISEKINFEDWPDICYLCGIIEICRPLGENNEYICIKCALKTANNSQTEVNGVKNA